MSRLQELRKKYVTYDELFDAGGDLIVKDKLSWKISRTVKSIHKIPRNFIRGIKSFWYWRKIIWNNRWYDYSYILDLIEHQLKLMVNPKNKYYSVSWPEQVEEMKLALRLLEEFRNTPDLEMESDYFDEFMAVLGNLRCWWD